MKQEKNSIGEQKEVKEDRHTIDWAILRSINDFPNCIDPPTPRIPNSKMKYTLECKIENRETHYRFNVHLYPSHGYPCLGQHIEFIKHPGITAEAAGYLQYTIGKRVLICLGRAAQDSLLKKGHKLFSQVSTATDRCPDYLEYPFTPLGPWEYIPNIEPFDYSLKAIMFLPKKSIRKDPFLINARDLACQMMGDYHLNKGAIDLSAISMYYS